MKLQEAAPQSQLDVGHALAETLQNMQATDPIYADWQTASLVATQHPDWADGDPKTIIDGMIADLPDRLPVYAYLKEVPERGGITPPPLQAYLLGRLPELPDITTSTPDYLPKGILTVRDSMRCLGDEVRTKKFLQSVGSAVEALAASNTGAIEVLDAGTGAIPVMAIYAALCSDRVQCTALELNHASTVVARSLVANLGLQNRIQIVEADATTYVPANPVDLLISETMRSGLTDEPIVQIMSNLQPHVRPGGITLPSAIKVVAGISTFGDIRGPRAWTQISGGIYLADATRLWHDVVHYRPGDALDHIDFCLPVDPLPAGEYFVGIASKIQIGRQVLQLHQSIISLTRAVDKLSGLAMTFGSTQGVKRIEVSYAPGSDLKGVGQLHYTD